MAADITATSTALFRMGNCYCQHVKGIAAGATGEESVTHSLGRIPDEVIIINTSTGDYVVQKGATAATKTLFYIDSESADASCNAILLWYPK